MLLQVLISDLASDFFHSCETFSLLIYVIPCHTISLKQPKFINFAFHDFIERYIIHNVGHFVVS